MATAVSQGLLTFAFTDIVGSTRLWERAPTAMHAALGRHNDILTAQVCAHHGTVFKTVGDACCCVFDRAPDAVRAAIDIQRALALERWSEDLGRLEVRIGIHTGAALLHDGDYFGPPLNRVARITAAAHGGQILISEAVATQIGEAFDAEFRFEDLGAHRLKDLAEPQHLYQIVVPDLPHAFPAPATLDARPNNLPSQLSRFIGREHELAELRALLAEHRLVTVCGAGGSGKTRLALQCAADTIGRYADGSWLVRLADVENPDFVPHTVAATLHISEVPGKDVLETLNERLRDRTLFLVLDNAEQVVQSTAAVARALLTSCPGVKILVTSREPLHVSGERVLRLGRMAIADAAELFLSRACLDSADRHVFDVCEKVGGLPLGIEIAAGRIGALSTKQLANRLNALLPVLISKDPTQEERHRTLRTTIDWSYRLLNKAEQRFFSLLAVFEGGFTLEACEALADGIPDLAPAYDLLDALVDKSFVSVEPAPEAMRYRLLEALREFACEKLELSADLEQAHRRHFAYYRSVAENPQVAALAEELPNLRAALEWGFTQDDRTPAYELLLRVALYWQQHCNIAEGRSWFARACAPVPERPTLLFGKMLRRAATFATIEDDYRAARDLTERALEVFRALGDRAGVAEALHNLAVIEDRSGSAEEASRLYAHALTEFEATGHAVGVITALYNLAQACMHRRDYIGARAYLERGMALCGAPEHADRLASFAHSLGDVALRTHDYEEAARTLHRALEMKRRLQNPLDEVEALLSIASLQIRLGDHAQAGAYAREALLLARELSVPSALIGCLECFAVIAGHRGNAPHARELMALAKALRRQHGYVYSIVDELSPELQAMSDVQPLPEARPEEIERLEAELLSG